MYFITATLLGFQHPALRMASPQRVAMVMMSEPSDATSDASAQVHLTPPIIVADSTIIIGVQTPDDIPTNMS